MSEWQVLTGDVRDVLQTIQAESVQCVVTSPPYWGLRDYGAEGQIGLEPSPDAYVAELVGVFVGVRRVLRDDGVCWLNLGDSYHNGDKGGYCNDRVKAFDSLQAGNLGANFAGQPNRMPQPGLKPKDLTGIPWRVAFALQADGWYLRSDIIWSKPNPMPESVTDRPTKAHEYVFLLTKSERYYYDAEAITEPYAESTLRQADEGYDGQGLKDYEAAGVQNPSDAKRRIIESVRRRRQEQGLVEGSASERRYTGFNGRYKADPNLGAGRNKRSVWTINTQPYPEAHFATFPEKLVEPCILAGSRVGDLVLDPFCGSGTTGAVAIRHQRNFVGVELNPVYVELARKRIGSVAPLFAQEASL